MQTMWEKHFRNTEEATEMSKEALRMALEVMERISTADDDCDFLNVRQAVQRGEAIDAIKQALAAPLQEPVACVYKATTKKGETAHFGEYSAAKAWAGLGSVEHIPIKTLTLIEKPCSTCEVLARTVMLDQTSHDNFKPDWDAMAVMVEEMQRMAKRIEELEAMLERQTARIVDLQTHIENFDGEDR
jgi:hypothetical protein